MGFFHTWTTEFPDPSGVEYDGPGSFGVDTSGYNVSGGVAEVVGPESSPDATFSPVEQWPLDGDLLGEFGVQDINNVRSGVAAYTDGPIPATQAFDFSGQLIDSGVPIDPAVELTGDMSMQLWVYTANSLGSFGSRVISCSWRDNGGEPANTFAFALSFITTPGTLSYGWEDSSGASQGVTVPSPLAVNTWHHVVCTRDVSGGAGNVQARLWVNGVLLASSDTLNGPGPTTNNRYIRMGDSSNSPPTDSNFLTFTGRAHGVTLYDRVLEQHEIIALYKKGVPEELR